MGANVQANENTKADKSFLSFFNKLKSNFTVEYNNQEDDFLKILNKAHSDWEDAELYFQSVTEPDLIDYAIYKMEAARTKYVYLLKQAKEKGIKAENLSNSL
ncbi:DUF2508 family protein [Brassicibacter mesophilus]|jgi:uncharacterized protein DUF2508|uniref:DUF2508 family protein n=1 Tax=Brassicibacter mesophilus TaxID=745119 RepID=UPI003D1A9791